MYVCIIFTVSVSVNGSTITYPILIYHDEVFFGTSTPRLDNINSPGDVICRSENHHRAHWRSPSGRFLVLQNASYKQSVSVAGSLPSLSRLSTPNDGASPKFFGGTNDNVIVNGLWTCQVDNSDISDQDILGSFKYVGIYTRGNGKLYNYASYKHCVLECLELMTSHRYYRPCARDRKQKLLSCTLRVRF